MHGHTKNWRGDHPALTLGRAIGLAGLVSLALGLSACGGGGGGSDVATPAAASATDAPTEAVAAAKTTLPAKPPGAPAASAPVATSTQAKMEQLGRVIFGDRDLSEPRGTACVNCHAPGAGFASNNGSGAGVPLGSRTGVLGLRNAMSNAYNAQVPAFGFRQEGGVLEAVGGHFWDGRADTLAQQALGPFLNAREMNNPDAQTVVSKIARASYAPLFREVFGADALSDPQTAFQKVGQAIEAFERSAALQPYSSKYDAMVRKQATLSAAEQRGMALFMDSQRANCAGCHLMNPNSGKPEDSPFSDFSYYATGIPRNSGIPDNADPGFFDLGLCGPNRSLPTLPPSAPASTRPEQFCGKFRMVSLRNVALRRAYMHNGKFKNLREVVEFYSTRNSNPNRWYGPAGIPNDLPLAYLGNIERGKAPFNRSITDGPVLKPAEVDDLLAFLQTLTDGYTAAPAPTPRAPVRTPVR